jgi:hypothetical protein
MLELGVEAQSYLVLGGEVVPDDQAYDNETHCHSYHLDGRQSYRLGQHLRRLRLLLLGDG